MPETSEPISEDREVAVFRNDLRDVGVHVSVEAARDILFLAERKYNRYDLYAPGETFSQRLLEWLGNFETADRNTAMEIVQHLRFFNQTEMRALAAASLHNIVAAVQHEDVSASRASAASYIVTLESHTEVAISKSLFMALADDVMFDFFRRNAQKIFPSLGRDNFVEYYKLPPDKVPDLAEHSRIFLLDQFAGSSRSVLRKEEEGWRGKLPTFVDIWGEDVLESGSRVYYIPFIMSTVAERTLQSNLDSWQDTGPLRTKASLLPTQMVSVSSCLSSDGGHSVDESMPVSLLCDKYYDRFKENVHTKKGGGCKYGFGEAGLTVVLYTNCPNNSIYLIWHKHDGWKPLFERVEHHRD